MVRDRLCLRSSTSKRLAPVLALRSSSTQRCRRNSQRRGSRCGEKTIQLLAMNMHSERMDCSLSPMSDVEAKAESGKKLLHFFKNLGKFVARSMMDSRIIDISFNPTFFKLTTNNSLPLSIGLLRTIDQDLANSIATLPALFQCKSQHRREKVFDSSAEGGRTQQGHHQRSTDRRHDA